MPPSARQLASPTRSKFSSPLSPSIRVSQPPPMPGIRMSAQATSAAIALTAKSRFIVPPPRMNGRILGWLVARDALARLAHVVAAQFPQRIADEGGGDVLAPVEVEVGVVHRLRARLGHATGFVDYLVGQLFAFEEIVRFVDQERPGSHGAERDPRAAFVHGCGDAEHRKVECTAAAELPIRTRRI